MESFLLQLADTGKIIFQTAGLPIVIWTVIAGLLLLLLRRFEKLHPQYHYHARLALLAALPLGILSTIFADAVSTFFQSLGAESNLVLFSVISPLEISLSGNTAESVSQTDLIFAVSIIVTVTGFILCAALRFAQWVKLLILRRSLTLTPLLTCSDLSDDNLDLLSTVKKRVWFATTKKTIIPVTFGLFRPVILLPETVYENKKKMNLAVRHELTHIQQHDFGTNLIVHTIQSVFWFHPLVHLTSAELEDYREMRCDSIVLSDNNVSRKEYASLLFELLPVPTINHSITINMAQKSSNLKERIDRIIHQKVNTTVPGRSSLTLLGTLLVTLIFAMACTDMQTQAAFDDEELDLMTDVDQTGERDYQQILIFLGEEGQTERHEQAISKLDQLRPEYIREINILKGESAAEKYGERGRIGVIEIRTKPDAASYNTALGALGMESDPTVTEQLNSAGENQDDFFVVVDEMPELIGGLASIANGVEYPEEARRAEIEGRVYIQFIVNEEGDVENPRVIRGIGGGADEEALRVVRKAKFRPGMQRGKPVRVQYSLPIVFRLQQPEPAENSGTTEET